MKTTMIDTTEGFVSFAQEVLSSLPEKEEASVVCLKGDLGAGKTTFTQALAGVLGVKEQVTSPTFMLMRSYETTHDRFKKLVHIDAYRIEEEREVSVLKLENIFKDKETLVCIEWPERISGILPENVYTIEIEIGEDNKREVSYG